MYKHLYDNFQHWYHNNRGTIYFYSDPHFGDEEVRTLRKNNISDEEQVRRINKVVGKYDTIVFLGDIGDTSFISKIRGYKVLIKGNHDSGNENYRRLKKIYHIPADAPASSFNITGFSFDKTINVNNKVFNQFSRDNHLFDEIYEGVLMIAPNIILSHEPIDFPYAINIHGHDHSNACGSKFNMCAENIDYTPVALNQIIKSGALKHTKDIHRNAIDNATIRKKK